MNLILDYLADMLVTLTAAIPLYALIRFALFKLNKKRAGMPQELLLAVFVIYLVWLASETVFPELVFEIRDVGGQKTLRLFEPFMSAAERLRTNTAINFIPLRTMKRYIHFKNIGRSMVNLVGNVVIFIPLGMLIPLLWKKMRSFFKVSAVGLACTCCIEFIQLFIGRSVDIDDIILNLTGAMAGYAIALLCMKYRPALRRKYVLSQI